MESCLEDRLKSSGKRDKEVTLMKDWVELTKLRTESLVQV